MFTFRKRNIRARGLSRPRSSFKENIIKGVVSMTVVATCIFVVHYVTRLEFFTITTITVEGGETISHENVRAKVEESLMGNYLGLIPKRVSYFYPHDAVMATVSKIPHMKSVYIDTPKRNILHVSFEEYMPHALWCVYGDEGKPCYFLSIDGVAFAEAPPLHGGSFMRHYTEVQTNIQKGEVVSPSLLKDIEWFVEKMENEVGLRAASVLYKLNKDIEISIHGGGVILISSEKSLENTFDNLALILSSEEYKHLAPGNFKYVDVRFDKKVFVNEQLTPVITVANETTNGSSTQVSVSSSDGELPE